MLRSFFLSLIFSVPVLSSEYKWELDISEDMVVASMVGNIMNGDRYRIVLNTKSIESCNIASSYTSNYAVVDDAEKKYSNLPAEHLLATINKGKEKERFLIKIHSVYDFLGGKRTFFYLGGLPIDRFLDFHKDNDEIYIELLAFYDAENQLALDFEITEYFDIPKNSWNTKGLEDILFEAKSECIKLIK